MFDVNFEYRGQWFVPTNPKKKLYGTLIFDSKSKIQLELVGSLRDKIASTQLFEGDIILGETTNGKQITLYKCFEINYSMNFPGTETQIIDALYIFEGAHFTKVKDLHFKSIKAELLHLNEWLGITGFKLTQTDFKKFIYKLKYKLPNQIDFPIDKNVSGKINFTAKHPGFGEIYEYKLNQNAQVIFEAKSAELDFESSLDYLHHFQDLITIGTYDVSYPKSIILTSDNYKTEIGDKVIDTQIKLYYNISISTSIKPKSLWLFLFNYRDIKPYFKKIITKWYGNKENLDPVRKILMESFYNKGIFSENRFLNIVQALETFHRRTRKNIVISETKHKKRIEEIKENIPNRYLDFINGRLIHSNEPTLHSRLEKLINEFNTKTFDKIVTDKDKFIKQTKDSRNYYTHYDPSARKKALTGGELYYLTEKLKVVLVSAILKENGFSFNLIQKLLARNEFRFFNHIIER